jgi:hypothetical protein
MHTPRYATLVLAGLLSFGCGGDQAPTSPNVTPSFSSLSTGTSYTVTFTCNAPATNNSLVDVVYYEGSNRVIGGPLACDGTQLLVTGFDNFTYDIVTENNAFEVVRECVQHQATVTRTGKFSCNRNGLTAVLTVQAQ